MGCMHAGFERSGERVTVKPQATDGEAKEDIKEDTIGVE